VRAHTHTHTHLADDNRTTLCTRITDLSLVCGHGYPCITEIRLAPPRIYTFPAILLFYARKISSRLHTHHPLSITTTVYNQTLAVVRRALPRKGRRCSDITLPFFRGTDPPNGEPVPTFPSFLGPQKIWAKVSAAA
jgi:hypothetical protein